jgi:hypothetical protein
MAVTAYIFVVAQSSTFVVAKSDHIKLPKKFYRPTLPSKFREPFQDPDRVEFLEVKPAYSKEGSPL